MSKASNTRRSTDALGVLPLETVIAQEHDRIHGDDVTQRINRIPLKFTAEQVISTSAFAHRLLRAWKPLLEAGARASHEIDPTPIAAEEAPLDAVAIYVIARITDERRRGIYTALQRCQATRDEHAAHPTSSADRARADQSTGARIEQADAALVTAMIPHLNYLLDQPVEDAPAFAPFITAGAIDALGDHDKNTDQRQRRLLLEAAFDGQLRRIRDVRLDEVFKSVRLHDTAALCLSGGGIRSATFAVGVVRGLAHFGLLSKFDYLSTVSGGGYAGSWLSAWMHHTSAHEVHEELKNANRETLAPEPAPMHHLRAYSHFLAPRVGMFSTDTWTLLATIGRNLLLNWLVLLPLVAAGLLLPRMVVSLLRIDYLELRWPLAGNERILLVTLIGIGITLGVWASRYVHCSRPITESINPTDAENRTALARMRSGTQREFIRNCFVPLVAGSLLLTMALYLWWTWGREYAPLADLFTGLGVADVAVSREAAVVPLNRAASVFDIIKLHPGLVQFFIVSGLVVHVGGWLLSGRPRKHRREAFTVLFSGLIAGLVGLVVGVWFLSRPDTLGRETLYATLAPPAYLGVMLVGSQLFTAFSSSDAGDAEREWVTRFNAWLLIAIIVWASLCALVLYGPQWVTEGWQQLTVAGVGGGAGLLSVFLARNESNSRKGMSGVIATIARRFGLALAAPVFVVAIIVALAAANEGLIGSACELPISASTLDCRPKRPRPDDLSHSLPFVVIARHLTDRIDSLSQHFGSTGSDRHMLLAFARADTMATKLVAQHDLSPASWDALVEYTTTEVNASATSAHAADSVLRARSTEFTRAVLKTDSATVKGIGGDSVLRALFSKRGQAEVRADAALSARLLVRDSAAALMDQHLDSLISLAALAQSSIGFDARPWMLGVMHDVVSERLHGSIATFEKVREDSLARAKSRAWVESAVELAGAQVPFDGAVPLTVIVIFAALAGLSFLLGWKIDTNKFSLRAMYEMRLVRAYLGASRPTCDRQPNPFTGFDPRDDFPIGQLWPAQGPTAEKGGRAPTSPPMHVVNVTLNLVSGSNLAWQQRKAESMTITPLHAGSAFVGYRPTTAATVPTGMDDETPRLYGGPQGITLGTAVTISGAAASPNAGSMSTPAITFLMTFFNARLGAWLGNPGRAGARSFDRSAPVQNIKPIVDEMFGLTTDISPYVYLSDGGHFENLALYEMVMRRCRFIVVSDAGCDPTATFDDLGNAVRKIRVDLGIPIEFPDKVHIYSRGNVPAGETGSYWSVGRIKYSAVDGGDEALSDGILLYIKPAIYEREPSDVQQYSRTSELFPHEPTSDQFFSESQFESYRALGEFIVRELVAKPLAGTHIDVKGSRAGSLLTHWSDLLQASDSNVQIPATESGVWPTAVEKQKAPAEVSTPARSG